ncbi:IE2 [Epiphyas postvittana nucleopolyhedrovirus]|uniref:IE2 n=1 Tax=Epiphyas postvittana nucleopolyhedrovirus TaxID=70600 RepID=Q91GC4_NPVEP|nr:IE2 [Epiphyas postvittana nucleopolyhedrovirus]AAK85695.1 IE2 [Epiphyas postvittana nucleopolyhedrovirus]
MSRQMNVNTPVRRRRHTSNIRGRRLSFSSSPDNTTPVQRRSPGYSPAEPAPVYPMPAPRRSSTQDLIITDNNDNTINYSPVHSPDFVVLDEFEDEPQEAPAVEVDMAVFCHICSWTFGDTENRNSSFVTSSECNHAVCFKCYTNIIFDKSMYKCSICNRTTPVCRVYNHRGFVHLKAVETVRDTQAIKTHWDQLRENNMDASTINIQNLQAELKVLKLEAELAKLRASTTRAQHEINMVKSDNQLLKQHLEIKSFELKQECITSENWRKQTNDLQTQLDEQVADTKLKMEKFAQSHSYFMEKCTAFTSNTN